MSLRSPIRIAHIFIVHVNKNSSKPYQNIQPPLLNLNQLTEIDTPVGFKDRLETLFT